ncbi:hypothetical protein [Gynurincola endophyticus]|uniref:hypothetical protein n=1 Tax=Gynurincola endophyticus TaxID=2479004 RepID=UPI000F8E7C04|nr:hypothetical protein [Gynurincola endophyticus]
MKFIRSISFLSIILLVLACSRQFEEDTFLRAPETTNEKLPPAALLEDGGFEISYWIDIDLRTNNGRGYWFHTAGLPADSLPTSAQIWGASSRCRFTYHGLSLYVIYHRQFEIDDAKSVFKLWKYHAENMGMKVIPVLVLEDYMPTAAMNFTDTEIGDFAEWLIDSINNQEIGVYDIYSGRQATGTAQNTQLGIMYSRIGNKIVRVGQQPGEAINPYIKRAVQDMWSAECQGKTNALWETPVTYMGTNNWGKNLLLDWVNQRISGDTKPVSYCLIPVAWDYDAPLDPYGYIFPGDDALTNDPPIPGRVTLAHNYIVGAFPGGSSNAKFGGYSCDLKIVQMNSTGNGEANNFYNQLKNDIQYTGYFAGAINEIGDIYSLYDH